MDRHLHDWEFVFIIAAGALRAFNALTDRHNKAAGRAMKTIRNAGRTKSGSIPTKTYGY